MSNRGLIGRQAINRSTSNLLKSNAGHEYDTDLPTFFLEDRVDGIRPFGVIMRTPATNLLGEAISKRHKCIGNTSKWNGEQGRKKIARRQATGVVCFSNCFCI